MPISRSSAFSVGFEALRANPLRTILSTLGVVMGVGAMVSVLSMGDGVEAYARKQIADKTDLLGVAITPRINANIDGQFVRRTDIIEFRRADAETVAAAVGRDARLSMVTTGAAMVTMHPGAAPRGFGVFGTLARELADTGTTMDAGRAFADTDTAVVVLNRRAAGVVAGDSLRPEKAIGMQVVMNGHPHEVIGVISGSRSDVAPLTAVVPVDDAWRAVPGTRAPTITLIAARLEDVDSIKAGAERWAKERFGEKYGERLQVVTNQRWLDEVSQGMLVFKLLMGAITGVSLLVGGIGIMNVLLAAVAERTREIGIRKATGARDRDILTQFLGESVAITSAGAAVGVVLGLSIAFLVAWIMRTQTDAPVQAAVTPVTILVAAGLSVMIGLVFGLYPALRASRLSPIDAIRHE